jgi:hypothetical protein
MFCNVLPGTLDGNQVILLKPAIDARIGFIIGYIGDDLFYHFHHPAVGLEAAGRSINNVPHDVEIKELHFCICLYQCRMKVIVAEKFKVPVLLQQRLVKVFFKIKNGTLVRHRMGMCDGMFVTGLGYEYAAIVRIEGMPEYIEKEISFSDKADTK